MEPIKNQKKKSTDKKSTLYHVCPMIVLILLVLTTVLGFILVLSPEIVLTEAGEEAYNETTTAVNARRATARTQTQSESDVIATHLRIVGVVIVAMVLLFALFMVTLCVDGLFFTSIEHSARECLNLFLFAAFTKLPIDEAASDVGVKSHENDVKSNQSMQVNFGVEEINPAKTNRRLKIVFSN